MPTANTAACSTRCASTARNTPACRQAKCSSTWRQCAGCGVLFLPEFLDFRRVGVELAVVQLAARRGRKPPVAAPVLLEALVVDVLQVEQRVVRALGGADQLVELELDRLGVAVLRVLDQEHHQEGDDRGGGVDDQLPGIAEAEQ